MSDFFASVGEFFEQIGRDIHAQYDATRRSYNRANAEDKREKSARATGIVTERDAGLKTLPEYVYTLGDRARVIDAGSNAIERVEDRLGSLTRAKTRARPTSRTRTRNQRRRASPIAKHSRLAAPFRTEAPRTKVL